MQAFSQDIPNEIKNNWQFRKAGEANWYKATVPGTVHTDLLVNKLIPDPFYRENETALQWIDQAGWEYRTFFNADTRLFAKKHITLVFDGLDTYAEVYLNGTRVLEADNMFRGWTVDIKPLIRRMNNELLIRFSSAQQKVDSMAKAKLPLVLPDNNRVYVRKAQFQFGWDWGPKFVGCGIWKPVRLIGSDQPYKKTAKSSAMPMAKLIRQKDATGISFYFEQNGKPIYAKGANWIPADIFLPRVNKNEYRRLLQSAKDANMNMLRVWGGGVYEDDAFYDLCDELGIMVWQDFMFAGGMYPGDESFFSNVKAEVKYQVERLRHHPCIVLWCGNNEIDEAWHNWGWQGQFNLHGDDSAKVWNDYKRLFEDSLAKWVNTFDGKRPYVPTSPQHGWGHKESFTEGDSHYWGVWWGLEDWEAFENKTGRFVSEYGMQAMPNWNTVRSFSAEADQYLYSPVILSHQKANEGFKKLNHYLDRYFIDSAKLSTLPLEDYTYLTQCLQYYILRSSIAIQRSKFPVNMGTLLWQLNDCWPVASWSITDYSRQPKAAWYAVREAYRDDRLPVKDPIAPKNLKLKKTVVSISLRGNRLTLTSSEDAKFIQLSKDGNTSLFTDNYFDLKKGESKVITLSKGTVTNSFISGIKIKTLNDLLKED
ncbi:MAG: glycoside hydrolase family 2 protein [Chitinophagaceae bacterium]|nr:glycoside hydrolase family 2 protein [Chitinophagaceae bacterium]